MKDSPTGRSEAALGIGAVVAMVLCCAGPALLAAGALGAVGAWFGNPLVIAAGAGVVLAVVLGGRRRRSAGGGCCPPGSQTPTREDEGVPRFR
jgi:mercuric ion transport protein